jgi:hypothetical protein
VERERRSLYMVLMGKPERKRPPGRPRYRWKDNFEMDLHEVGCSGMDWIELVQDRDQWRALVFCGNEHSGSIKLENSFTSCKPVNF